MKVVAVIDRRWSLAARMLAVDGEESLRDNRLMSEEKSLTRRQRVVVSAIGWIVAVPFVVGMFFINVWLGVIFAAMVVFTTWDYIRKGDFGGHAEDSKYGFG